ncbi:MAG TPA: glycosyltransferase, partial [Acidimicrobiales bacterium]|nr:glycosyltransferase [Acidimicrobiales bacterium]
GWARDELGVAGLGDRAWAAFEAGVRGRILDEALAASSLGAEAAARALPRLIEVYRSHAPAIEMLADARAWLGARDPDVLAAVVTDGPLASQRAKAEAMLVDRWAADVVFTEALGPGRVKPHPAAFEHLQHRLGVSGRRCAYVADNPVKDFAAPRGLGWRTVRIRRPGGLHADLPSGDDVDVEITTLADLDAALGWDAEAGAGAPAAGPGGAPRARRRHATGGDGPVKVAHLTTVDSSLTALLLPQLTAVRDLGGTVLGISAPGPDADDLARLGVRHLPLPSSTRRMAPLADLAAAHQLWRILRRERPDVLHTHNPKPGLYGRVVGRLAGVPVVVNTCHGLYLTEADPPVRRAVLLALEGIAARFSDAELVQGVEDHDRLVRRHAYPRRRTRLLGNGVDLRRFRPGALDAGERSRLRAELGAGPDRIVVGMVGRLVAEKGLHDLLAAARRLDDRYLVVVVGPEDRARPGALDPATVSAAEADGVRFLGRRRDVDRLDGAFDIFVLPSWREGVPRAAMEAAASGLPVIATDVRGCRQVVDDGVTGLLVPVRDPEALASAIMALGRDPGRRAAMGAAAARRAADHFDERRVVDVVLDTYRDVAARKRLDRVARALDRAPSLDRGAGPGPGAGPADGQPRQRVTPR